MEPDFWHERWHSNQIAFHQDEVNPFLRAHFGRLHTGAGASVFVPLCGKSLDMVWIADQGVGVIGVELSPRAVEAFFAERGLTPQRRTRSGFEEYVAGPYRLLCGDFFALSPALLPAPMFVYDRASLVALPRPMRQRYVVHLCSLLSPGARILLVTFEYDQAQMDGPPFAVSDVEVRAHYDEGFEIERLAREDVIEREPRFRERGLSALTESTWLLTRRP